MDVLAACPVSGEDAAPSTHESFIQPLADPASVEMLR